MRTYIVNTDNSEKEVKNLGWLVRHLSLVESITLSDRDDGARCGCKFVARLSDGRFYVTSFNSYDVAKSWISARRGLKNVRVTDLVDLV
jgi:hypothetical protein